MKKWLRSLSGKQIKLGLSAGICAILSLLLTGVIALLAGTQAEQRIARRWSSEGGVAQVSCFFSPGADITPDSIESFEHSLDNALKEASIELDSTIPARGCGPTPTARTVRSLCPLTKAACRRMRLG